MADTSNLTSFLGDIADAIRTKKETTEEIPAADFDTEILSIETGIDTSDATATSNDIINPKTAYVNGSKVEGAIITDYESSEMTNENLAYSVSNNNCCGISPDGKYIVTTSGSNVYIYERVDNSNNNLVSTTSMSDIGISNSSIYQICVSYTYITGNKCYVAFRTTGTTQTIFVTTLNFDTFEWTTAYSLPTVTTNYNGGAMCFAKYTTNIIAVIGRNGHSGNGNIYRLTESSYTSVSTFSLSNQDRTGDLEFQGHDKFLVANHTHHWDGHTSGYIKLSSTFAVLATVNTGENNYVFYNNSNKVVIIASNGTTISYGTYTDNGSSITLGTLTTVNISMNCCVGYIDADDEVIYSYGKTNKIQAYSLKDNSFTKLGECAATGYFDLGQPYRIAFSNTGNIILCSMGTSLINGLITDKSGRYLAAMTRTGVTYYNTNDSTATKANVLEDKIVYNSEGRIIGTLANYGAGLNTGVESITPDTGYDGSYIEFKAPEQDGPFAFTSDKVILTMTPQMSQVAEGIGLTADKLVKGNTVLGIEGTAEISSGDIPIRLFNSKDELVIDENTKESDIGIVYNTAVQNLSPSSKFNYCTFPEQVVLPNAITSSSSGTLYDDEMSYDNQYRLYLSSTSFYIMSYEDYSNIVTYSSEDGITYTRTSDTAEYTFSEKVYFYGTWNSNFGYFVQCVGGTFEGIYQVVVTPNPNVLTGQAVSGYTLVDDTKTADIEPYEFSEQEFTTVLNILAEKITSSSSTRITLFKDLDTGLLYYYQGSFNALLVEDRAYLVSAGPSTSSYTNVSGTVYQVDIETGTETATTSTSFNIQTSTTHYFRSWFEDITHFAYGSIWYYGSTKTFIDYGSTRHYVDSNSYVDVTSPEHSTILVYEDAPTQFSLANVNELIKDIVGFGKNNTTVTGDGTVWEAMPKNKYMEMFYGIDNVETANNYTMVKDLSSDNTTSMSEVTSNTVKYLKETTDYTDAITIYKTIKNAKYNSVYSSDGTYLLVDDFSNKKVVITNLEDNTTKEVDYIGSVRDNSKYVYNDYYYFSAYGKATDETEVSFRFYKLNIITGEMVTITKPLGLTSVSSARTNFWLSPSTNKYVVMTTHSYSETSVHTFGYINLDTFDGFVDIENELETSVAMYIGNDKIAQLNGTTVKIFDFTDMSSVTYTVTSGYPSHNFLYIDHFVDCNDMVGILVGDILYYTCDYSGYGIASINLSTGEYAKKIEIEIPTTEKLDKSIREKVGNGEIVIFGEGTNIVSRYNTPQNIHCNEDSVVYFRSTDMGYIKTLDNGHIVTSASNVAGEFELIPVVEGTITDFDYCLIPVEMGNNGLMNAYLLTQSTSNTISPTEYNTAITTVNEILGEEV